MTPTARGTIFRGGAHRKPLRLLYFLLLALALNGAFFYLFKASRVEDSQSSSSTPPLVRIPPDFMGDSLNRIQASLTLGASPAGKAFRVAIPSANAHPGIRWERPAPLRPSAAYPSLFSDRVRPTFPPVPSTGPAILPPTAWEWTFSPPDFAPTVPASALPPEQMAVAADAEFLIWLDASGSPLLILPIRPLDHDLVEKFQADLHGIVTRAAPRGLQSGRAFLRPARP